jgi:VanZ family protein
MRKAGRIKSIFRALTWCCVVTLAFLSLLPAEEMVRTGVGQRIEHFVAYAGSAGIAMIGYGQRSRSPWIILLGSFWTYAGVLEYLQHFSAGRSPALGDFAASALGALAGTLVMLLLRLRYANLLGR